MNTPDPRTLAVMADRINEQLKAAESSLKQAKRIAECVHEWEERTSRNSQKDLVRRWVCRKCPFEHVYDDPSADSDVRNLDPYW